MKIISVLEKNITLVFILFFTVLLRIPSLLEPFWYGDEGVYMAVGQGLLKGLPLYTGVFDNKPPGIYLLSAFSTFIFGHTIWSLRFVLLLWVLVTQIIIYRLAKNYFGSKKAGLIAAVIFGLLTSTPLIEGNIANGEIFFILFTSLGFLLGWQEKYFWAGIVFSLGFLFKAPAIFDLFAFGMVLLIHRKTDSFPSLLRRLLTTAFGFALPVIITTIYFLARGHFNDFFFSVLSSNVGYTNVGNKFIITNGLLYLKAIGLGIVSLFFLRKIFVSWGHKHQLSKEELVISSLVIWLFFSLYGSLFGGRNYSHYLIQLVPSVSLLLTAVILNKDRFLAGSVLVVALITVGLFGFRATYWRLNYYPNAIRYLTGQMSQIDYNNSFDSKVSRNYTLAKVANKLSSKTDKIYVWANEPQIYFLADRANADRYVAAYHTENYNGYQETMKKLYSSPPRIIIIEQPLPYQFPELLNFVKTLYSNSGDFNGTKVYTFNSTF